MKITEQHHDNEIIVYTLENNNGMKVEVINVGASIIGVHVPDRDGNFRNVVLQNETIEEYYGNLHLLGATIAPIAGRVKDAEIKVDGQTYALEKNEGPHTLHSGGLGTQNKVWNSEIIEAGDTYKVRFHTKIDGTFPGSPEMAILYSVNDENELKLEYEVDSAGGTAVAPTNHTYFNLNNDPDQTVSNHTVTSDAKQYLKMDEDLIPLSAEPCEGVFDLNEGERFADIFNSDDAQIRIANGGFDHYFLLDSDARFEVYEAKSGRKVSMKTDFPGLVFYTGNNLDGGLPLKGRESKQYMGFCMEAERSAAAQYLDLGFDIVSNGSERWQTVFSFSVEA
ncbi:galactose mutarotase [Salinicoccus sp. ID82-1]|uniref:aldose epimerase family protein n=1 Tax=Salinicoccus sp. ID82-1 TaxID=2820269 RepID=UPI001F2CD5B8|nr:aldose epimerase family protein [Salinicoccus sp. ID82-1]MCG1009750.1 galactose mutarotase [Salinicoccus sp. ID82-1]